MYLGRQLVAELKKLQTPGLPSNGLVLAGRMPTTKQMREHLQAAGIAYVDGQGRRLDFHALRMTFDTNLASAGVPDAVRMKLDAAQESPADDGNFHEQRESGGGGCAGQAAGVRLFEERQTGH